MKKTLLFLLVVGFFGSTQAQNSAHAIPKFITVSPAKNKIRMKQAIEKQLASQPKTKETHKLGSSEPILPFLGSSANINGVLDATTTAVTANQACNLMIMTHRDNYSNVANCGTGAYISAFSTNNGSTWDTTVTLFCNPASGAGARYPNGVIYNPTGNTNPLDAYDVESGPYTNGTNWVETVYGSTTLGGANGAGMYWTNGNAGVVTQNTGDLSFMSSSSNGTVHVIGEDITYNAAGTAIVSWQGGVLTTGTFSAVADSFVWTQTVIRPHIVPSYAGFGNSLSNIDTDAAPLSVPGTAWSQDGQTGYIVFFANLDSTGYNFYADQPIVYKTTDAGASWTMMTPENFATLPSLTTYLKPSVDGIKTPLWFTFEAGSSVSQGAVDSYDLTVDYQGNLHIFGAIVSSYYSNIDSSYTVSFYSDNFGYIYDVATTSAGGWTARYIDSMQTLPLWNAGFENANSDWDSTSAGAAGFGARIQSSRTTDGKHIFCTWEDDITDNLPGYLAFPDVFGEGYDVATGYAGQPYQFTTTHNNYYLCVSDIVMTTTNGVDTTYNIPCTIAFPQQTPDDGSEPINYFYLGNVSYSDTMGTALSVPTVNSPLFTIGKPYPNPFTNITQFNVGLTNESLVSVDVYNLFGQKVYSIAPQQMTAGNHLMSVSGVDLSAGVYLCKVTVGDQSQTQKIVVQ